MNKENNINTPKLLQPLDVIKLGQDVKVSKGLYKLRENEFYDVVLTLKDKEIFIGRFNKTYDMFSVKYNNGKILSCYEDFDRDSAKMQIFEVLSLYEVVDDTFYSCTEEEALTMFDPNIDTSYLRNKNNPIYRTDTEKRKRRR